MSVERRCSSNPLACGSAAWWIASWWMPRELSFAANSNYAKLIPESITRQARASGGWGSSFNGVPVQSQCTPHAATWVPAQTPACFAHARMRADLRARVPPRVWDAGGRAGAVAVRAFAHQTSLRTSSTSARFATSGKGSAERHARAEHGGAYKHTWNGSCKCIELARSHFSLSRVRLWGTGRQLP